MPVTFNTHAGDISSDGLPNLCVTHFYLLPLDAVFVIEKYLKTVFHHKHAINEIASDLISNVCTKCETMQTVE